MRTITKADIFLAGFPPLTTLLTEALMIVEVPAEAHHDVARQNTH